MIYDPMSDIQHNVLTIKRRLLPEVGELKSYLHKGIRTQLMLLWYIFPKMRKHENFHV